LNSHLERLQAEIQRVVLQYMRPEILLGAVQQADLMHATVRIPMVDCIEVSFTIGPKHRTIYDPWEPSRWEEEG